jgi:hypothetical protein
VAKNYKQSAKDARKFAEDAKVSSVRHTRDLAETKQRVGNYRQTVKQIGECHGKRQEETRDSGDVQ